MTREDVQKLLATIQVFFPNYKVEDKTLAVNGWISILEEHNTELIQKAFKHYVTEGHEFAPNPGQLIQTAHTLVSTANNEYLPEGEAWSKVLKALQKSTYYSEEEFKGLPETIQRAIGSPNMLRTMATDDFFNEEVARSNFLKAYREIVNRDREDKTMAADVKAFISERIVKQLEENNRGLIEGV